MKNFSWEKSQFDSELFGFPVAKIISIKNEKSQKKQLEIIDSLLKEFKQKKIKYATFRLPTDNFQLIQSLEKSGFIIVDEIIAMEQKEFALVKKTESQIRIAALEDLADLKKISLTVFKYNRFFNDKIIPVKKANELFSKWIENSLKKIAADEVLVWDEKDEVLGYVTIQKNGHIPLIAVSSKAQGRKIARKLIIGALSQFSKWNSKSIKIETQITNIPAIRSYQSCGFKIVGSYLTLRWSSL